MNRVTRFSLALAILASVQLLVVSTADAQIVINEVLASNRLTNTDEDGDSSDWVELYNSSDTPVQLAGFRLSEDAVGDNGWVFPDVVMAPDSYLLVWCSGKDRTQLPEDQITERNSPHPLIPNLASLEDEWKYLNGSPVDAGPTPEWIQNDFDDSAWSTGTPGFGFGREDNINTPFEEKIGAAFFRRKFDFAAGQSNLVLQIRYDDGFVAYLNGVRVASGRFDSEEVPTFESEADGSHSARIEERFLLPLESLQDGENVLAIALMNTSVTSSDMLLFPELGNVAPSLHTDFNVSSLGETLHLLSDSGEPVSMIELPSQSRDQSYGLNETGEYAYFLDPTPLAVNSGPNSPEPLTVSDTLFDHDRGFYEEPIEVRISTETLDADIRFTLDGSVPTLDSARYEGPVPISRTTVLRARAFKEGHRPTNVDTHTYFFIEDIVRQTARTTLDAGFPNRWGTTNADYGLDPDVIGPNDRFGGIYAETIREDLRSLPTISIVTEREDMFGTRGIYTNSSQGGIAWERPASVEMISEDGRSLFQEDCGVRIQGGFFRNHSGARKHSFRLLFKGIYGTTKLRYPLFGDDGVDQFDTITLRGGGNDGYTWNGARLTEQYTRDEFGRNLQLATGNAASRGTFVHLYVNGLYWGLYNPAERPDHSFSAENYGGNKDEWDSVHDLAATNGNTQAWTAMVAQASRAVSSFEEFMAIEGKNPDGTRNPELDDLLDVDNYIDYLVVNVWGGN
ncbi:MAG: chitobiase/beta-hexosaminidase C-terminal domain-containing protein, partial [Planctomycetota bacterium]